ncbi:MAG: hypothetical protein WC761_04515 [Candidatus Paceibacterota bacterium]|jgi:hypothetical protein
MINHLAALLERFKGLRDPKEERQKIAEIVSKELGFDITEDLVELKKNVLTLKVDNYLKSEIFMRKEGLLEALKKEKFFITEIR